MTLGEFDWIDWIVYVAGGIVVICVSGIFGLSPVIVAMGYITGIVAGRIQRS